MGYRSKDALQVTQGQIALLEQMFEARLAGLEYRCQQVESENLKLKEQLKLLGDSVMVDALVRETRCDFPGGATVSTPSPSVPPADTC